MRPNYRPIQGNASDKKMAELVLYIARKCATAPSLGQVKIAKILYYSDRIMYAKTGEAITWQRYLHQRGGPLPKQYVHIREELRYQGKITLVPHKVGEFEKDEEYRTIVQDGVEPDLSLFTAEELATVDEQIAKWWDKSSQQVSNESHRDLGWRSTTMGQDIPYETVFWEKATKLTPEEKRYAESLLPEARRFLAG